MKGVDLVLVLAMFILIESVVGSVGQRNMQNIENSSLAQPKNEDDISDLENEKYIDSILNAQEKDGIFLVSYVGDYYIGIQSNKLVAVKSIKDASMFDISIKDEYAASNSDHTQVKVQLLPWVDGERRVITYNPVGESINIEIPIENNEKSLSDSTIFQKVISMDNDFPVYEIKSAQRDMCITLDPATKEYLLRQCSNGANDLQTFKFSSYTEALLIQSRKKGENAFDLKMFLVDTKIPFSPTIIADTNGVLYKE